VGERSWARCHAVVAAARAERHVTGQPRLRSNGIENKAGASCSRRRRARRWYLDQEGNLMVEGVVYWKGLIHHAGVAVAAGLEDLIRLR